MERDMLLLSQEKVATLLRLPILGTCISLPMEGTPEWAESYPLLRTYCVDPRTLSREGLRRAR